MLSGYHEDAPLKYLMVYNGARTMVTIKYRGKGARNIIKRKIFGGKSNEIHHDQRSRLFRCERCLIFNSKVAPRRIPG